MYQTKSDKPERKNREAEALYSPISTTDRTGQKISYTTNQQDPIDIFRTPHPTKAKYMFFSIAQRTHTEIYPEP